MIYKDLDNGVWLDYDIVCKLVMFCSEQVRISEDLKAKTQLPCLCDYFNKAIDAYECYMLRIFKDYVSSDKSTKEIFKRLK